MYELVLVLIGARLMVRRAPKLMLAEAPLNGRGLHTSWRKLSASAWLTYTYTQVFPPCVPVKVMATRSAKSQRNTARMTRAKDELGGRFFALVKISLVRAALHG